METETQKQDNPINSPVQPLATEEKRENNSVGMKRSHMRKALEKQSRKTVALTLLGVVAILFVLIMYGQTMLINFAVLLAGMKGNEVETSQQEVQVFIPAPVLEPVETATNSATIAVKGTVSADADAQIRLYVNDKVADVTELNEDTTFVFKKAPLKEGENEIKAQAVIKESKSKFSNILRVMYAKEPPELTIDQPSEGQTLSGESTLIVRGKTEHEANVTVNGFMAIVKDDGSFSQTIVLQNGENKIMVVATDDAGNKTEKEVKVTYSQ